MLDEVWGSEVQGSGFRVYFLWLILPVGDQIRDEASNGGTGMSGMIIHIMKLSFRYVLLIDSHVKFTLDFGARPLCIPLLFRTYKSTVQI